MKQGMRVCAWCLVAFPEQELLFGDLICSSCIPALTAEIEARLKPREPDANGRSRRWNSDHLPEQA